jgi:hypothetical protein
VSGRVKLALGHMDEFGNFIMDMLDDQERRQYIEQQQRKSTRPTKQERAAHEAQSMS